MNPMIELWKQKLQSISDGTGLSSKTLQKGHNPERPQVVTAELQDNPVLQKQHQRRFGAFRTRV